MNDFDVVTGPAPSALPAKVKAELAAREVPLERKVDRETSAPAEALRGKPNSLPSPLEGEVGSAVRTG